MKRANGDIHCAAVDLGATSGRVIVGTWDGRKLRLTEVHRFANQFRSLAGHDYWDVPYLWAEARAGLLKAREQFPALASVGVDAWGVDHVLVDRRGRPVFPTHAYRDNRTARLSAQLGKNGIRKIYTLSGLPNYPYNTSLQLQETLQACPGIADTAARCLFIADYFNFLLSGRMRNEISISSHAQMLDVHGSDWSDTALAYFGVPRKWFSRPQRSPAKLGPVRDIPELKGVEAILVPGHDTACAFAAMPAAADGTDLYLSSGTWSLLGFESDRPVLGDEAREARVSNERMGDGSYRPLKSCLGLWLIERLLIDFKVKAASGAEWNRLLGAAEAASAPKALLDLGDTALFNPPSMRAAILAQLKRRKLKAPRDLPAYVRLICESLGRSHADALETFERLSGKKFKRILMVGGGSKNRLLCQATASAAGVPVVSFSLEGSTVGNLANQLIGLGAVKDLNTFRQLLSKDLDKTIYHPA